MPPSVSGSMLYLAPLSDFVGNAFRSRECGVVSGTDFGKDQWLGRGSRIRSRLRISQNHRMHQVQAQALRPRDVSRPPVGSSSDVNTTRQIQSPSSASGTFFNCIQVSLSAPGGQAHVLLYQIVGDARAGCRCHQYQYILSSNGFWPRRTRTILRSATITPHQRQD